MHENQITIIRKAPNGAPEIVPLFDNTLEAFQEAVGGHIEHITISDDVAFICNEEGRIRGLPRNMVANVEFFGTVLAVGIKGEEFCSVPAPLHNSLIKFMRGNF